MGEMRKAALRGLPFVVFCEVGFCGDKESRTPDLCSAIATLYQLSYIPEVKERFWSAKIQGANDVCKHFVCNPHLVK